jgi:thymidylate kinase
MIVKKVKKSKEMKKGKFIVIEGGMGSGKSTLYNQLKSKYRKWSFYREPGSTPFGERIRKAVQGYIIIL